MDTENRGVSPNDPLKSLFKEVGHLQAPAHLEQHILDRMVVQQAASRAYPPLITRRTWMLIGAGLMILVAMVMMLPLTSSDLFTLPEGWLPLPSLTHVLGSKWLLFASVGALMLMLLDRILSLRSRPMLLF